MKSKLLSPTSAVLANVRLNYANIFEPKSVNNSEPKYSVSLIIDKEDSDTLAVARGAIKNAVETGTGKWGGKVPRNLKTPLRDGDEERDDEAYANAMFINATSKVQPIVVGKEKDPVTGRATVLGPEDVYSGSYANVVVNFFAFDVNGNRGIAAGLGNIQKERDGEPLGGSRIRPEDTFEFDTGASDLAFLN